MNTGIKKTDLASLERLKLVNPDLLKLFTDVAKGPILFSITEGMRTKETQAAYVKKGVSWTMNSRHLTGHAVDCVVWVDFDGDGDVEPRYDWPLYYKFAEHVKSVAMRLGIDIEWGGDWSAKKKDGPHWQLSMKSYPSRR